MLLRVLGTAAGGGVPQWNCGCSGCAAARRRPSLRRLHASIAISADAVPGRWYVVNATPDLTTQLREYTRLWPEPGSRRLPLAGIVLTDAELDHTLGLFQLREAEEVRVMATAPVRDALASGLGLGRVLASYTNLVMGDLAADGSLDIQAIPVSGKRPRYAADLPVDLADERWSVALRIAADGVVVVYAPCVAAWSPELDDAVAEADCLILDGTFWDDDEPRTAGFSSRTASQMGHLPIHGPQGTAERLAKLPATRRLYTHLNNSNPLVDADSPEHRLLADLGLRAASEGELIHL